MDQLEIDFLLKIQSLRSDEENYKEYKNIYVCSFQAGEDFAKKIFDKTKKFMTKKLQSNKDYQYKSLFKYHY